MEILLNVDTILLTSSKQAQDIITGIGLLFYIFVLISTEKDNGFSFELYIFVFTNRQLNKYC